MQSRYLLQEGATGNRGGQAGRSHRPVRGNASLPPGVYELSVRDRHGGLQADEVRAGMRCLHAGTDREDDDVLVKNVPRKTRSALTKRHGADAWNVSLKRVKREPCSHDDSFHRAPSPNTEKEHEVAEVLFDLANMFAANGVPTRSPPASDEKPDRLSPRAMPSTGRSARLASRPRRNVDSGAFVRDDSDEEDLELPRPTNTATGRAARAAGRRSASGEDGRGQRGAKVSAGSAPPTGLAPQAPAPPMVNPQMAGYYHPGAPWAAGPPGAAPFAVALAQAQAAAAAEVAATAEDEAAKPPALRKYSKRCASHVYIARFIEWQQKQRHFGGGMPHMPALLNMAMPAGVAGNGRPGGEAQPLDRAQSAGVATPPPTLLKAVPHAPASGPKLEWPAMANRASSGPLADPLLFGTAPLAALQSSLPPLSGGLALAPAGALHAAQLAQLQLMGPNAAFFLPPGGAPSFGGPPGAQFAHLPAVAGGAPLSLFGPPPFGLAGFPAALQQLAVSQATAAAAGIAPAQPLLGTLPMDGGGDASVPREAPKSIKPDMVGPSPVLAAGEQATAVPRMGVQGA